MFESVKTFVKRTWTEQGNIKGAKLLTLSLSIVIFIVSLLSILIPVFFKRYLFIGAPILYAIFEAIIFFAIFKGNSIHRKWALIATIIVFIVSLIVFNLALLDFPATLLRIVSYETTRETFLFYLLIFEITLGIFLFLQLIRIVALAIYNRWSIIASETLPKDRQLEITIPTSTD